MKNYSDVSITLCYGEKYNIIEDATAQKLFNSLVNDYFRNNGLVSSFDLIVNNVNVCKYRVALNTGVIMFINVYN